MKPGAPARPLVSVCVAAYNDGESIGRGLESVIAQSFSDYEIVVADDASTDDTVKKVLALGGTDVRLIRAPRNRGEARTMNAAIRHSRGRYIKLLHADDELTPDCLATMVDAAMSSSSGMTFSTREIVLEDPSDPVLQDWAVRYAARYRYFSSLGDVSDGTALFREQIHGPGGILINRLVEPSGALLDRETLEQTRGFHLQMVGHLDIDMWLRAIYGRRVAFVDRPLFRYRRSAVSASSRRIPKQLAFIDPAWCLEGMRQRGGIFHREPHLYRLQLRAWKDAVTGAPSQVRLGPASWKARRLLALSAYSTAITLNRAPPLHGTVGPISTHVSSE